MKVAFLAACHIEGFLEEASFFAEINLEYQVVVLIFLEDLVSFHQEEADHDFVHQEEEDLDFAYQVVGLDFVHQEEVDHDLMHLEEVGHDY